MNITTIHQKKIIKCTRFCGSHNESNKYYKILLDYIEENHYIITSFAREITMIDYGITNDTSKFATEICIPIKY